MSGAAEGLNGEDENKTPGYMSKEAWIEKGNDADEWVSEEEFKRRGVLMDAISKSNKENKALRDSVGTLEESVESLVQFSQTAAKNAHDAALRDLKADQNDAVKDNDAAKVKEIGDEIIKVEAEAPIAPAPGKPKVEPEIDNWVNERPWFKENAEMSTYAHKMFGAYTKKDGLSVTEALAKTDKAVKRAFKEDFPKYFKDDTGGDADMESDKGSSDVLSRGDGSVSKSVSEKDLTPTEQACWNVLKNSSSNKLTLKEYLKQARA